MIIKLKDILEGRPMGNDTHPQGDGDDGNNWQSKVDKYYTRGKGSCRIHKKYEDGCSGCEFMKKSDDKAKTNENNDDFDDFDGFSQVMHDLSGVPNEKNRKRQNTINASKCGRCGNSKAPSQRFCTACKMTLQKLKNGQEDVDYNSPEASASRKAKNQERENARKDRNAKTWASKMDRTNKWKADPTNAGKVAAREKEREMIKQSRKTNEDQEWEDWKRKDAEDRSKKEWEKSQETNELKASTYQSASEKRFQQALDTPGQEGRDKSTKSRELEKAAEKAKNNEKTND